MVPVRSPNVAPDCINVPRFNDDGFEEICHLVEMDDALNECPHRDGKCPVYIMGDEDQDPTGFLMCDDPTFIASCGPRLSSLRRYQRPRRLPLPVTRLPRNGKRDESPVATFRYVSHFALA